MCIVKFLAHEKLQQKLASYFFFLVFCFVLFRWSLAEALFPFHVTGASDRRIMAIIIRQTSPPGRASRRALGGAEGRGLDAGAGGDRVGVRVGVRVRSGPGHEEPAPQTNEVDISTRFGYFWCDQMMAIQDGKQREQCLGCSQVLFATATKKYMIFYLKIQQQPF